MANKQIIITDNLYNLKYDEWYKDYYSVYWNENEHIFKNLLEDPNTDVVINFNDKKDKRQKDTKLDKPVRLNFTSFLSNSVPDGKLIFNQKPDSDTVFNVYLGRGDYPPTNDKKSEFIFNGSFSNMSVTNAGFKNLEFNQQYKIGGFIDVAISDNLIENIKINSPIGFSFKSLNGKNIKNLTVDSSNCSFGCNNIHAPLIEKIDCLKAKTINLSFDDWSFSSLSYKSPDSLSLGLADQLKSLPKSINPNCDIILSPNSTIKCYKFLPSNRTAISVKTLFNVSDDKKEIHTTPYELIYKLWTIKTEHYLENIQKAKNISEEYLKKLKNNESIQKTKENIK